jgi:multiple sugar transport system permease protein
VSSTPQTTAVAAGAAAVEATRPSEPLRRAHEARDAYIFLAPYLLLFVAFVIAPFLFGAWISLRDYDYSLPNKPFVGLDNYTGLFDGSSAYADAFWDSMQATWLFTALSVPLLLVLPLVVALVMNQKFRGRNFFRAMYFAPYVLGVAVIAVLWRYLLDSNIGLVNHYLGRLGLPDDTAWLTSLPWAWVSLVGVTVWWTLGFNTVIYLAALGEIPSDLYEAARVDGASPWQRFWHITIPGLRPVLLFITSVTIIASVNMFGQSFLMTQGGPGTETRTAIYQIADTGLTNFNSGASAAMSMVFSFFLMLVSLVVFVLFRERTSGGTR